MKKFIAIVIVASFFASCEEKKSASSTETSTSGKNATEQNDSREKEISDSTTMLDKKLADPADPHTPDSLK